VLYANGMERELFIGVAQRDVFAADDLFISRMSGM
jgi:hypothetical protein